jgi:hypothetical protein
MFENSWCKGSLRFIYGKYTNSSMMGYKFIKLGKYGCFHVECAYCTLQKREAIRCTGQCHAVLKGRNFCNHRSMTCSYENNLLSGLAKRRKQPERYVSA